MQMTSLNKNYLHFHPQNLNFQGTHRLDSTTTDNAQPVDICKFINIAPIASIQQQYSRNEIVMIEYEIICESYIIIFTQW
jgi:hypothetical protein